MRQSIFYMRVLIVCFVWATIVWLSSCRTVSSDSIEEPQDAARRIYEELAPFYNSNGEGDRRYDKYLTSDFLEILQRADAKADSLEDFWLDWDPWIAAQDFNMLTVEDVRLLNRDSISARVAVYIDIFKQKGGEQTIILDLQMEEGEWKVKDLLYPSGGSMRTWADEYFNEP